MKRIFFLAALGLTACDGGKADTGDGAFAPAEGDWLSEDGDVISDGCGIFDDGDTGDTTDVLTITMAGESSFTVTNPDTDMTCTLSGMEFSCEPQVEVEDLTEKADIILTSTLSVSGSFSSETAADAVLSAEFSCAGSDCGFVEQKLGTSLPCTSSANASLTFGG